MERRRALSFDAPGVVSLIDEPCPAPGPGEVLVATRVSAVSAGTELLAYRGELPEDLALDEALPAFAGARTRFPFRYGYAAVGTVTDLGAGVDPSWRGRRVFSFAPHASAFVAPVGGVFAVPDGLPDEVAPFLASAETAVNLVLDGRPLYGEVAALFGQGLIGLFTTALLARFPLRALLAVEPNPRRAALAARLGARIVDDVPRAVPAGADLVYELSGNPTVLDAALAATGREGRVVVGSFYGRKRAPVDLGGHFHRGRLTIISSQVTNLGPGLSGRWDRARRMGEAWGLLERLRETMTDLISHRVPFGEAPAAYQRLARGDADALGVLFTFL